MKLTADAWRWMADMDWTWLCLRTDRAREACEGMEQGKVYDVELSVKKKKRSLDANAYAWVLMDKLSAALRIPKTVIYRKMIREIGGNSETVCVLEKAADRLMEGWSRNGIGWMAEKVPSKIEGCVNVILYYGSSVYDTSQMSRLIDLIVQDCREFGIETLNDRELGVLKEGWK